MRTRGPEPYMTIGDVMASRAMSDEATPATDNNSLAPAELSFAARIPQIALQVSRPDRTGTETNFRVRTVIVFRSPAFGSNTSQRSAEDLQWSIGSDPTLSPDGMRKRPPPSSGFGGHPNRYTGRQSHESMGN